jgi:hypothetical protein
MVSKFAISSEIYILFCTMVACSDKGIKNYYTTILKKPYQAKELHDNGGKND